MAYTFKKLSEVEALSEKPEDCNVLIETGGSIKRTPSSSFGGGGNEEPDLVIRLALAGDLGVSLTPGVDLTVASGSVQTVTDKINEDKLPKVIVRYEYNYGGSYFFKGYNVVENVTMINCGSTSSEGIVSGYGVHLIWTMTSNAKAMGSQVYNVEAIIKSDNTVSSASINTNRM